MLCSPLPLPLCRWPRLLGSWPPQRKSENATDKVAFVPCVHVARAGWQLFIWPVANGWAFQATRLTDRSVPGAHREVAVAAPRGWLLLAGPAGASAESSPCCRGTALAACSALAPLEGWRGVVQVMWRTRACVGAVCWWSGRRRTFDSDQVLFLARQPTLELCHALLGCVHVVCKPE